jgi:polyphosphate kinase
VSENIRVISIVGRFLEHSRLWYFANGGVGEYFVGSSDWMPRNFDRRVEAVAPIENVALHPRLQSLFETCLRDNRQSWELGADGEWRQRRPSGEEERATHRILLEHPWGMTVTPARDATAAAEPTLTP